MRKLALYLTAAVGVVLCGCSSSDVPLATVAPETAPLATGQSQVTVGASGAVLVVDGAIITVPAGSLPVGTVVTLEVSSDADATYFEVDFGGATGLAAASLEISSLASGGFDLYGAAGSSWVFLESSTTGDFERPVSATSSFKMAEDDLN